MIQPGRVWTDVEGAPIESHLGGVLYDQGRYYWYGTNFDGPTIPSRTLPRQEFSWYVNRGVTIYSSDDLLAWRREGVALDEISYRPGDLLQPLNGLVRPKVVKCGERYVMMAALTSPDFETFNDVVVATSTAPTGPFEFRGLLPWRGTPNVRDPWLKVWDMAASDAPDRIRGFDMTLYQDDDGRVYLVVGHHLMWMYELSEDGLSAVRMGLLEGVEGEAPAIFKHEGVYYLLASRLTGWAPNENLYYTADSIWGPWRPRGAFAVGLRQETTFDSQTTFVLPVHGRPGRFIFMADRFGATSAREIPDLHGATHVWLPIDLDTKARSIQVRWRDEWDPKAWLRR